MPGRGHHLEAIDIGQILREGTLEKLVIARVLLLQRHREGANDNRWPALLAHVLRRSPAATGAHYWDDGRGGGSGVFRATAAKY